MQLALPGCDDAPPCLLQLPLFSGVAFLVELELPRPEVGMASRHGWLTVGASMPEAPIDEDS